MVKESKTEKFIRVVERIGNKLPDPFMLFGIFAVCTAVISAILSKTNIEGVMLDRITGLQTVVRIENLLTFNKMREILSNFPDVYINFPSLKIVLMMMIAIGVAEEVGFFEVIMRKYLLKAPKGLITLVFVFVCIVSNIMSDAGVILTLTLGGVVFSSIGRSPHLGIILGYAACNGGFCANFLVSSLDALLSGITEQVVRDAGFDLSISPLSNYYFMAVAIFTLTISLTIFTEKFIMKLFPEEEIDATKLEKYRVNDIENRGLKYSFYGFMMFIAGMLVLSIPKNSFFRNEMGEFLPKSPLLSSVVSLLFIFFLVIGIAYGIGAQKIKKGKDVYTLLQVGVKKCAPLLVTFLTCALFMEFLNKSNVLKILAIKMADLIKSANVGPLPLLILVIILTALMNPFMTSASTKWILLAPIVAPVFAMIGVNPAYAQLAYRLGDSATNIISPLHPAITVILGLMLEYNLEKEKRTGIKQPESGFGTIFALTLPYSVVILTTLTLQLIVWYLLGLPIGIGMSNFL